MGENLERMCSPCDYYANYIQLRACKCVALGSPDSALTQSDRNMLCRAKYMFIRSLPVASTVKCFMVELKHEESYYCAANLSDFKYLMVWW